jgi:hypothetical protein
MSVISPGIYGVGFSTESANFADTAVKILSFGDLPLGWHYGEGGPIPENTLDAALAWNRFISPWPFDYTDAFPGDGGRITIAAGRGNHYIEIIIEPDFKVSVAYDFERKQKFYRLRMSDQQARKAVLEALGEIWNASISFTLENTMFERTSLFEMLSPTIEGPYQLSRSNVPKKLNNLYADIFEDITYTWTESAMILPFFGNLIQTNSQMVDA